MTYFIASVANGDLSVEQSFQKMQSIGASPGNPWAEMFKLEVPSLMVGTLDSLMTLSDELVKTDMIVENIVRKIEKASLELGVAKTDLTVGAERTAARYIPQFAWDYAKYPNRRPLKELVSLISGGVGAVDEELKQLSTAFGEKQIEFQEAKRRKGGNLLTADLNNVLTEEIMRTVEVHDTEYLKTIFIAVPKGIDESFNQTIYTLGNTIVGYGGPDWKRDPTNLGAPLKFGHQVDRHSTRGSPVVPGSVQRITSDSDSILYCLTILKSQYEAGYYEGDEFQAGTRVDFEVEFAKCCREKRYVIRDIKFDPNQGQRNAMAFEQLQVEVDSMRTGLTRWCKTHYGEAFVAWTHIKVIRVFVESVLRYGLPVDFTAVLYKVNENKDQELVSALDSALGSSTNVDEEDDDEYHDFVLLKFDP